MAFWNLAPSTPLVLAPAIPARVQAEWTTQPIHWLSTASKRWKVRGWRAIPTQERKISNHCQHPVMCRIHESNFNRKGQRGLSELILLHCPMPVKITRRIAWTHMYNIFNCINARSVLVNTLWSRIPLDRSTVKNLPNIFRTWATIWQLLKYASDRNVLLCLWQGCQVLQSAHLKISCPNVTKFPACLICGHGSFLLRQYYLMYFWFFGLHNGANKPETKREVCFDQFAK